MSQSRKYRGNRSQLLVSEYFKEHGWPHATSAGAGRSGSDVLNMLDISVEVKARTKLDPLAWHRQTEKAAEGRLPLVVFRCNGQGEDAGNYFALLRLKDLVPILRAAGYGDGKVS